MILNQAYFPNDQSSVWLLKRSQLQLAPQRGWCVPLPSSPGPALQQMFMGALLVDALLSVTAAPAKTLRSWHSFRGSGCIRLSWNCQGVRETRLSEIFKSVPKYTAGVHVWFVHAYNAANCCTAAKHNFICILWSKWSISCIHAVVLAVVHM